MDTVSNYMKLPDGIGGQSRESIQKELLRGKFKITFPAHITDIDSKLFKLAEDPVFFQLYKRGDLIDKIKADKPEWSDLFTRRYFYSILAEERAI